MIHCQKLKFGLFLFSVDFPLIASKRIQPEQVKAIQLELQMLPTTEAGREVLKHIGIEGFDLGAEPRMGELLKWLNVPPT